MSMAYDPDDTLLTIKEVAAIVQHQKEPSATGGSWGQDPAASRSASASASGSPTSSSGSKTWAVEAVPKRPLLPGRSGLQGNETYRKERVMSLGHDPDDKLLTVAEVAKWRQRKDRTGVTRWTSTPRAEQIAMKR